MRTLNSFALTLLVLGGLNWGMVGLFNLDLVQALVGSVDQAFAGSVWNTSWAPTLARVVYTLIGASAIYCLVSLRSLAAPRQRSHPRAFVPLHKSI